jgi:uncharacterized protein (DUF1800 family)
MSRRTTRALRSLLLLGSAVLTACGGGGGSGNASGNNNPPPPPPSGISKADAYRFLDQASFGPTEVEAQRVVDRGYAGWIDDQIAQPASLEVPYLQSLTLAPGTQLSPSDRLDAWFRNATRGPDQLRQRVAFALSEIMVVSDQSVLVNFPLGLAYYYDLLAQNAFGNFRELMETVTLNPSMGVYLSMLGNEKPDAARNIRPDENYARELMQLFTIGLVELNPDGTEKLDAQGQPIPTYTQEVIEGFAHVYTGWTFGGSLAFQLPSFNFQRPMQAFAAFHATGPKLVLRGTVIPAGQSPEKDLEDALDNIFNHPNVGPFIARRLIERLTSSNPSPAYVQRVAVRFDNNGSGVRGDLGAVVRAILLDPEARAAPATGNEGKLKEPLIRLVALWRAFDGKAASGRYLIDQPQVFFGQAPLRSPSVFNFFPPDYQPAGELTDAGLFAPEMGIVTEYSATNMTNYLLFSIYLRNQATAGLTPDDVYIDFAAEQRLAADPVTMVNRIVDRFTGGRTSEAVKAQAIAMASRAPLSNPTLRAAEAIFLIATSPEYAALR